MMNLISRFSKDAVLNVLTVIPAFFVAVMFEMRNGDNDNTAYMLGLVLGIFVVVLCIQAVCIMIFRTRRQWVNAVVAIVVMLLTGALLATMVTDPEISADYSSVELSFLLDLGTQFLGAAAIVVLFQLRRIGVVVILMLGTFSLGLLSSIGAETSQNLSIYTNLSAEIFGALLTGWVIYRVIDLRDNPKLKQKPKNEE